MLASPYISYTQSCISFSGDVCWMQYYSTWVKVAHVILKRIHMSKTIGYTGRGKSQKIVFRAFRNTTVMTSTSKISVSMFYFVVYFEWYQAVSLDHFQFSCKYLAPKHSSEWPAFYFADFKRTDVVRLLLRDCQPTAILNYIWASSASVG